MTHLQSLLNAPDKGAVAEANFEKLDTRILKGTATLDFASINAAAYEDLTITVTGAQTGDGVILCLPAAPDAGIVFQAFVSASNTVTVRATNITGSPINPASGTFQAIVLRY